MFFGCISRISTKRKRIWEIWHMCSCTILYLSHIAYRWQKGRLVQTFIVLFTFWFAFPSPFLSLSIFRSLFVKVNWITSRESEWEWETPTEKSNVASIDTFYFLCFSHISNKINCLCAANATLAPVRALSAQNFWQFRNWLGLNITHTPHCTSNRFSR